MSHAGPHEPPPDGPPPALPARDATGHKGTFGRVGIVGGCARPATRMIGAPTLAAVACLRAGAGLARIAAPAPILDAILAGAPSATGIALPIEDATGGLDASACAPLLDALASTSDALVVGPGLGEGERAAVLRCLQQEDVPLVLDADALNAMSQIPELFRDFRARAILTPHPGEFRRLAGTAKIGLDPTDPSQRPGAAMRLAQRWGCVVVLKGAGTIVSDGLRWWRCEAGSPAMATGGTGDVLAGVVAGIVAQACARHALSLYDAARLGVLAHARAGEAWAASRRASGGMLARELADELPPVVEVLRAPNAGGPSPSGGAG